MSYPPPYGYPPQHGGYPPQGGYNSGYPPQHGGYPPQGGYNQGYPPQGGGYPPQGGYPPSGGYNSGYPPPSGGGYPPPSGGYNSGYPPPSGGGGYPPPSGGGGYPPPSGGGGYPPPSGGGGGYPPPSGGGSYPPPAGGGYPSASGGGHPGTQSSAHLQNTGVNWASCKEGGRRKALLIGINYFRTKNELKGCINDVKNLREFLVQSGYPDSCIRILTDDNPNNLPTKANIIAGCKWLIEGARPGDHMFFHYSGHGGQEKDTTGDEADGYDETILPSDFQKAGQIIDDDLHAMMVQPLPKGSYLTAIFDSCHSGSVLDLPFTYKSTGGYQEPGLTKQELGGKLLNTGLGLLKGEKKGTVMKNIGTELFGAYKAHVIDKKNMIEKASPADVVMLAGCRDNQTSADANIGGQATGAMSFALATVLRSNPRPTLIQLLNSMRDILIEKNFKQVPQMSTSHEIDPNTRFSF